MTKPYFDIAPFIIRDEYEQEWEDERGRGPARRGAFRPPRARLRPAPRQRPPVRRGWPIPTYFTQLAAPCVCPPPSPEPVTGAPLPPDQTDAAAPEPAPPDGDREVFEIAEISLENASSRIVKDFSGPASEC